jgi:Holliday junction resolvasome RuvABC endonuclease subunit
MNMRLFMNNAEALMKYVGIDTSFTGTGFAIKDDTKPDGQQFEFKTIKTKPEDFKDDVDRICFIRDEIIKSIPENAPVVIEDVFVGHGPSAGASLRLALLAGCVRAGLRDRGINFTIITPTMVKKHITGKGNANKEIIMMTVLKKFGIETTNNNEADAICLCELCSTGIKQEPPKKKTKKIKDEV